jgi:hypothetical protein
MLCIKNQLGTLLEIKSGWEKSGLNRICHGKLGFKLEGLI